MKLVDIESARKALHRFCKGEQVMRSPAQDEDDDILIDRALDELEAARKMIYFYTQELKNQTEINRQRGY